MKKVLALALVAMMVIGMAPAALASTVTGTWSGTTTSSNATTLPGEIEVGDSTLGYSSVSSATSSFPQEDFLNLPDTYLGDDYSPQNNELYYGLGTLIWYAADDNTYVTPKTGWSAGIEYTNGDEYYLWYNGYTYKEIKDDKIDVKLRVTNGKRVVDEVTIKYLDSVPGPLGGTYTFAKNDRPAYIKIKFYDKWVSTSDVDYKFMIYLTKDKNTLSDTEVTFEGNFENNLVEVDTDDVYVYLSHDTPVVKSLAYLKNMEIELEGGVTVWTKLFNEKKYYAYAEAEVYDEDDAIITKYPAIDYVYNIASIGLNNSYTTVTLDEIDGERFYVYNANLEYIGTSNEKLPFSSKYYVSSVELDVDGEDVTEPTSDYGDDFESDPGMGGDDVPENVNDNPGTGC